MSWLPDNAPTVSGTSGSRRSPSPPSERAPLRLMLVSHLYPRPKAPAAGVFIENWMRAMAPQCLGVHVISPQVYVPPLLRWSRRYRGYIGPAEELRHGLHVSRPPYLRPPGTWFRRYEPRWVLRAVQPIARRLHAQAPAHLLLAVNLLPDGLVGIELGKELHLPVVVNAIGSDVTVIPNMGPRVRDLAKRVCRQADLILCQSDEIRLKLLELGAPPQRAIRFWRGLDIHALRAIPSPQECRRDWALPEDGGKLLVFVGALVRPKGIFDLLEALANLRPLRWRLGLVGEPTELPAVLQRARQLGIADRLIPAGSMERSRVLRRIEGADILVLPSYSEGMPNVVLEAFALGTPVVASRAGGLRELANMDQPFWDFAAGDVAQLTRCLRQAIADPQQAQARAARAQRVVQEHFDMQRNCRQLLDMMKSLVRRGGL